MSAALGPDPRVSDPVVSVVITTYNDEKYIARALASVLEQATAFPFEVIVAEDCSTDGTRAVIERAIQGREGQVLPMFSERNTGGIGNFLLALARARGRFIALLDGDDYWTSPHKLSTQVQYLSEHPECPACFHNVEIFYDYGDLPPHRHNGPGTPDATFDRILAGNFIAGPSPMFRRETIEKMPLQTYDVKWPDWAMHVVASQYGPVGYIDEVLAAHRIHERGMWSRLDSVGQLVSILEFYEQISAVLNAPPEESLHSYRRRYGDALAAQARIEWREGRASRAFAGWGFLARHHPRALLRWVVDVATGELSRAEPRHAGVIESIHDGLIAGWVWDAARPARHLQIEICDGDRRIARFRAEKYRPDLLSRGMGDGHYGFAEPLPEHFKDGTVHEICLRAVGSSFVVVGSGKSGTWRDGKWHESSDPDQQVG